MFVHGPLCRKSEYSSGVRSPVVSLSQCTPLFPKNASEANLCPLIRFSNGGEFNKPCVFSSASNKITISMCHCYSICAWRKIIVFALTLLVAYSTISVSWAPGLAHSIPHPKPAKMQGSFNHMIAADIAELLNLQEPGTHKTCFPLGKDMNRCITHQSWFCTSSARPTRQSNTAASLVATAKQLLKHTHTHTLAQTIILT